MTSGDPDDDYRPRPLLGILFWAMILLTAACVAGGVAIVHFARLGETHESR